MTRKSKARYNLNRTYKVSQTVKALRRALALGLATAVVAPAAQAGTCISVINDVFCFGDFGDTTLDSWNELSVYDTFDPATVEFDGSIYTNNDEGIIAWNNSDLAFGNDGSVIARDWNAPFNYNSGNNMTGVYAESFQGDVTFDNTGVIAVVRDNGNWGANAIAARVEAAQDITVTNSGFIASENDGGFTAGLQAVSYNDGIISITNALTGDLGAEANDYGDAIALGVYANGGTVNITNNGDIGASSYGDSAFGIRVFDADTTITTGSTSEINVQANDQAFGIYVSSGDYGTVDITNAGLIETDAQSDLAAGVKVDHTGYGDVSVSNSGLIDSYSVSGNAAGIYIETSASNVSVSNSSYGTIYADGFQNAAAVLVQSDAGNVYISNDGTMVAEAEDAGTIQVLGKYNNTVTITNSGDIEAIGYDTAVGTLVVGNGLDVTVSNYGSITADEGNSLNAGVYIVADAKYSASSGTATVYNSGLIAAGGYNEFGAANSYGDAVGVFAFAAGDVSVVNTGSFDEYGTIAAYTEGGQIAIGVQAVSVAGNVSITNTNDSSRIGAFSESFYGSLIPTTTIGIYAEAGDGSVNVNNGGIVVSVNDNYGDAIGIRAEAYDNDMIGPAAAYAADGDITVSNTGLVLAGSKYDNAYGVQAFSNYGDISITNTGNAPKYGPLAGTTIFAYA
ncbi:MAG: hypothetical protein RIQ43_1608, partial [Pseudomonadota bacterium]